jgi:hypothetical protein
MIKFFLLSITSFGLIGCMSISPTSFKGPSGKQAYSMMCSGMGRTMDACYQKAGEVCPNGYNIIDRSSGTVGFMNQGTLMMAPREQLAIECK